MAEDNPTLFDWLEQRQPEVEYRDIPGWLGYRVGDNGSVWTRKMRHGKRGLGEEWYLLNQRLDSHFDRLTVCLSQGGHCYTKKVHCLVMLAFVGPPPAGLIVCHIDGDATNNRLSNLRYGTFKDNEADKLRHGRTLRGERHHQAKLTADDVLEIRRLLDAGLSRREVSERFGVSMAHVKSIRRRRSWKWLA